MSGIVRASTVVETRSSLRPCTSLARKSADAGAMSITSFVRVSSMCAMPLSGRASHKSLNTGCPDRAWKVAAPTNSCALSVIATVTSRPDFTKRRVSSADLYAAIPPVMPSKTRAVGLTLESMSKV